ncbi:hypothetical protein ACHWQZ_G002662 [Mnemiopsis leidyi]
MATGDEFNPLMGHNHLLYQTDKADHPEVQSEPHLETPEPDYRPGISQYKGEGTPRLPAHVNFQATRDMETYTSPIKGAVQEKPLNIIRAANWSRCGMYCEHVTECRVLEYYLHSKICNLFRGRRHLGRVFDRQNASYFVSTKNDFLDQKCIDDYKAILKGSTFIIESHGKKMNFEKEEGMFWRTKRSTAWVYDNVTHQMRVDSSNDCLVWVKESHTLLVTLTLGACTDSENQKFTLIRTANCVWNLRTERLPGTGITATGYNQWDETHPRNLSFFKISLDTFACDRFVVASGDLLPKQYNAPVFLEGDIFTIKCKKDYTLKRKESRENNITLTCRKHDFRKVVCRDGGKSSTPQYIVLSIVGVCCIFLVVVFVRHLRGGGSVLQEVEEERKKEMIEMRVRSQCSNKESNSESTSPSAVCPVVNPVASVGEVVEVRDERGEEEEGEEEREEGGEEDGIVECCEIIPNPLNASLTGGRKGSEVYSSEEDGEETELSNNLRHTVLVHEAAVSESLHEHDSS